VPKNCSSIIAAEYTNKAGVTSTRAVAKFDDNSELMFAASLEEVKEMLAAGKTKKDFVTVNGQYGPYAAFSNFSETETLA